MKTNAAQNKIFISLILSVHFLICVLFYLNTTTFTEISESASVFNAYYCLLNGEKVYPFFAYWFFTPAFVAYFIHMIFGGTLLYYFIFQCLLSTVTVYLIYRTVFNITKSYRSAQITLVLSVLYTEYALLSSVFYNQLYEIFFVSLFLFLIFPFNDETRTARIALYAVLIVLVIYASAFFRKSLMFVYLIFFALLILNLKDKKYLLKFAALSVPVIVLMTFFNPYKMFNSNYIGNTETLFWGHTMYGGHGGEAALLIPENIERYNRRLKEFMERNNLTDMTRESMDEFEKEEIIGFIKSEPHRWVLLQARKVLYTFGVVPERDGLLMIYKGKVPVHWIVASLILQLPYAFILILFILSLDLSIKEIIDDRRKSILYLFGIYLIAGISLFGPYQERYRPVVFICFFIPVIALNYSKVMNLFQKEYRKELATKIALILLLLAVWLYQAYEVLIIYHDRYFKIVQ